jgi:hypothetical protein
MDVGAPTGTTSLVRKETWVEILGYAGVAAAVAGTSIAVALRADLSEGASLAIAFVVTVVLVAAGVAIGDRLPNAYQRMRSVLWFAAVESFGLVSGIFFTNILDLRGKSALALAGGIVAVFGLVLWMMLGRSLQQIAFFLTAAGTITALAAPTSFGSPSDFRNIMLVVWVCGAAWFVAGTAEIVRPVRTARVLGAVVALIGSLYLFASSFSLALALTSATSLVLLGVGDRREDRAVSGLGIVGILIASAVGVERAVGRSQGAATAAIAIGLALLVVAIVAVRASKPDDLPPIPPPPAPGVD